MAKKDDGYDEVLIRLRRKYSKDEVVAALNRKLNQMEIYAAKNESEIIHLKYQLNDVSIQLKTALNKIENSKPEKLLDIRLTQRNAKIKKQEKEIEKYRKSNQELIMRLNHEK